MKRMESSYETESGDGIKGSEREGLHVGRWVRNSEGRAPTLLFCLKLALNQRSKRYRYKQRIELQNVQGRLFTLISIYGRAAKGGCQIPSRNVRRND